MVFALPSRAQDVQDKEGVIAVYPIVTHGRWNTEQASAANKLFADSPLARQGRLSVVPLTEEQYRYLLKG